MLTTDQVNRFHADGFVLVAGKFTLAEVNGWVTECERLWGVLAADLAASRVQYRGAVSGGKVADRIDPVIDISPLFAGLARDPRILDAASVLFGAEASLMKAKLITKRPGTNGYLAHQDYPYWEHLGIPARAMLSVQVSIDRATPENGALELFPGRHHDRLPAPADAPLDTDESSLDLATGQVLSSEAGDLVFFHSLAPHRSGPNRAVHPRRTLYLTYAGGVAPGLYERYHAARTAMA